MVFGINIYLINGSICLAIGIILLAIKTFPGNDSPGIHAKKYLAGAALIGALTHALGAALLLCSEKDTPALYEVAVPVVSMVQLQLIAYGILEKINARSWLLKAKILAFIPLLLGGGAIFGKNYGLLPEEWVSPLLYAVFGITFLAYCIVLILKSRHFIEVRRRTEGDMAFLGHMVFIGAEYVGLFGLSFSGLLAQRDTTWPLLLSLIGTAVLLHWATVDINLNRVNQIVVRPMEEASAETPVTEPEPEQGTDQKDSFSEVGIAEAIHRWEQQAEKPYLKEGIAVADVAEQLGISDTQLSFVLNHSLRQNFSSWINGLRIEEAKRMFRNHPQLPIVDVAYASGFADATTFSRNFKKQTGISPSAYKTAVANEASATK